jgi:hypothetical protein
LAFRKKEVRYAGNAAADGGVDAGAAVRRAGFAQPRVEIAVERVAAVQVDALLQGVEAARAASIALSLIRTSAGQAARVAGNAHSFYVVQVEPVHAAFLQTLVLLEDLLRVARETASGCLIGARQAALVTVYARYIILVISHHLHELPGIVAVQQALSHIIESSFWTQRAIVLIRPRASQAIAVAGLARSPEFRHVHEIVLNGAAAHAAAFQHEQAGIRAQQAVIA